MASKKGPHCCTVTQRDGFVFNFVFNNFKTLRNTLNLFLHFHVYYLNELPSAWDRLASAGGGGTTTLPQNFIPQIEKVCISA